MHFQDIPTGDHVAGAEVLEQNTVAHANFLGIDLHEIAGMLDSPVFRLAHGPGALAQFTMPAEQEGWPGWFEQHTTPLQVHEDAPHHGSGNAAVLASQQHDQLILAPMRILLAQSQDALRQFRGPGRLAHFLGAVRTAFEVGQVVTSEVPLSAIEGLPADEEVHQRNQLDAEFKQTSG